jgi:hypothetical protein
MRGYSKESGGSNQKDGSWNHGIAWAGRVTQKRTTLKEDANDAHDWTERH